MKLIYSKKYTQYTRLELMEKVSAQMSKKRFTHVLGVEETAIKLAQMNNGDVEKASIAALVHDYAKERADEEMIAFIHSHHLDEELIIFGNNIWHGIIGAELIKLELGIHDEEILNAVRKHTTGDMVMSLLDKIIYVADYIEPNRRFPLVEQARKIAFENLNEAVKFETKHTLEYLIKQEALIYPKTITTYNTWVATVNRHLNK
ncbi:MAG: bis(5'-nucleosyl)-tetraphosphatase (symmetrical) YqeK [Streptococcaceae bacterium]|jgi:predicted HD superfamily hydrolase involved in NAD metabolism|nr:bis(5'-nucleosyl)-tetraphosphatase (symmetrical) YqeK [Streptococcaceae bacterium]